MSKCIVLAANNNKPALLELTLHKEKVLDPSSALSLIMFSKLHHRILCCSIAYSHKLVVINL